MNIFIFVKKLIFSIIRYWQMFRFGGLVNHKQLLKKCDILFICHDVDRTIKLEGKAYSPLIDSVRDDFESRGFNCLSIAHVGSIFTGNKGYKSPISINRIYLFYLVENFFLNLFRSSKKNVNIFKFIFNKTSPKLIIIIGANDEICEEANKKNILVVELLHGIGYHFLPWGWDKKRTIDLPKAILSLDDVSSKSFSPLIEKNINIFTIPHPFLKRFLPEKYDLLPSEWKLGSLKKTKYRKSILISLTWGYSGDHLQHIHFSNILLNGLFYDELEEIINANKDIFWRFRFHPIQLQPGKYENLRNFMDKFVEKHSNCDWKESSTLPFPLIAMNCSGNITMSSMACYDAATVGVPSLVLCPTIQPGGINCDSFNDLVDEGYVVKISFDKLKVESWVNNTKKISNRLSNLNDNKAWEESVEWVLETSNLK